MWYGEPPDQISARGVICGDALCLTWDGGYDYLFNIFETPDHPPGSTPMTMPSNLIRRRDPVFEKNDHRYYGKITDIELKSRASAEPFVFTPLLCFGFSKTRRSRIDLGFDICFKHEETEWAMLILTDGGVSEDIRER